MEPRNLCLEPESYYSEKYPFSSKYPMDWVFQNQMGPNSLWLMEWLISEMNLDKGMRILDLGCGTAMSSILLAEAIEGTIWAHDLWIKPTDNWKRIYQENLQKSIFPIYGDANSLPYAENFFQAIVSVDAYQYFGRTDEYLSKIISFLEPSGEIGVVVPGLKDELPKVVPDCLEILRKEFNTISWWKEHWNKCDLVKVKCVDVLENGWKEWLDFLNMQIEQGVARQRDIDDQKRVLADQGKSICFIRLVATKL